MKTLHERIERVRKTLHETIKAEAPGLPFDVLHCEVVVPCPASDADLIYFYGEGAVRHVDFEYSTQIFTELLQRDGIAVRPVPVTRGAYERFLGEQGQADQPHLQFGFLARACGFAQPPDTVVSCPLFAPVVLNVTFPGTTGPRSFLIV